MIEDGMSEMGGSAPAQDDLDVNVQPLTETGIPEAIEYLNVQAASVLLVPAVTFDMRGEHGPNVQHQPCQHPNHPYFPDRCLFPGSTHAARREQDHSPGAANVLQGVTCTDLKHCATGPAPAEDSSPAEDYAMDTIRYMNSAVTSLADSPVSIVIDMDQARARRGTTNRNDRGNAKDRERRRAWLIETYRADVDVVDIRWIGGGQLTEDVSIPACRCYRCGTLLTVDTVTVDRIIPGCRGGTYRRNNIRPACSSCNSMTGSTTRKR